jgi:hypothetical protein
VFIEPLPSYDEGILKDTQAHKESRLTKELLKAHKQVSGLLSKHDFSPYMIG